MSIELSGALKKSEFYLDLRNKTIELERIFLDTLRVLANAIEARDSYTIGHNWRVCRFAQALARELHWEEKKIEQIALLLRGALNAENMVGIKMNVPEDKLEGVVGVLPSLNSPTISRLYESDWFSIEVIVTETVVREIIPRLIDMGADGIIEYPLNKIVGKTDRI